MHRLQIAALIGWLWCIGCASVVTNAPTIARGEPACDGTGEIRGVVYERDAQASVGMVGTPLEGVTIVADGPRSHAGVTERDGRYRIKGLTSGEYALLFRAGDRVVDRQHVWVRPCHVTPIYMKMPPAEPGPLFELLNHAR
ncbi:MAG: carboxypeptidase-like regulatory domain-containing protein [Kofleriaceae bacterium]